MNRRDVFCLLGAACLAGAVHADEPLFHNVGGVAVSGFDVVSYFAGGDPVPGARRFAVVWKGAEWRFASLANREAFEANPWAYAPRYGGYCAFAMSQGQLSDGDPMAWRISDGQLYLSATLWARDAWDADVASHVAQADAHWPSILRR